jgi:uroporphyrinogen decarboxylase
MLTKRERVHATINRRGLDAIPWQFDLTASVIGKLKAFYGARDWRAELDDHITFINPGAPEGETQDDLPPDLIRSEFGAVWRRSPRDYTVGDWGELVDYPLKEPTLQGYAFPDGSTPRWPNLAAIRAEKPDDFLVAGGGSLFEAGWALCGFENYLSYIAGEPEFVQELTGRLADFTCALVTQLKGSGLDAVRFGDDWGFQSTLMVRPERWRKLFKAQYRRIYAAAHAAGLLVSIHSCGNITELLPDLIEIGVDVVHPLQPEAMDVGFCQREYGRDLTFWGGLGSQSTLPYGTPDDVCREVRERLDLFHDGGYILAPAGAAPAETPAENIVAIAATAKAQLTTSR